MNIYKNFKKLSLLKKTLIFLILLLLLMIFSNINFKREGFEIKKKLYTIKRGSDIFDAPYAEIYDNLVHNSAKNSYEIDKILQLEPNKNNKNNKQLLDIGCGTGHHVYLFNKHNIDAIGIDLSRDMINKSQKNYPNLKFKQSNALTSMEFMSNSFSYITCFYFTIYYIKNKKLFLQNCFDWLKPGGSLVIHLVNIYKFDPILPISNPFKMISPQDYVDKRITKSVAVFESLNYRSNFILNDNIDPNVNQLQESNATFKETIKYKNSNKTRVNEHKLYMQTRKSIINIAKEIGFVIDSMEEMNPVNYPHNYLYFLSKPN